MKEMLIDAAERGWLPDALLRVGIRGMLRRRLAVLAERGCGTEAFLEGLAGQPVAVEMAAANAQHYEVPTRFFLRVLGPQMKYSSCLYPEGVETLADAEKAMLDLSCRRAQLEDGQDILELGCGWGSLTLWMAERYPRSRIVAVSNSGTQRAHIETQAADRGLENVEVRTCDVNGFAPDRSFDRIVSVEMIEHMRNPGELLDRCAGWLKRGGRMFVHIFTHAGMPYLFEDAGRAGDWMSRYFFTGGMMPSADLLPKATKRLELEEDWIVNGKHYSRTLEDWLRRQDRAKAELLPILAEVYGEGEAGRWFQRWRMFWMACSELFRYRGGEEWPVHHYRFKREGDT